MKRQLPHILKTDADFNEAVEAVSGMAINFSMFSDAELRALSYQEVLTGPDDYDRRTAARMAYLGRAAAKSRQGVGS